MFVYDNQDRRTSRESSYYDASGALLDRSIERCAYPSRTDYYTITTEIDYDGHCVPEVTLVESRQVG